MLAITTGMDALDAPLDMARQVGLVGLAAAAGLALVALIVRRLPGGRRLVPLPAAGLALAAASMIAITVAEGPERTGSRQAVGVAGAALGGLVATWLPWPVRPLLVLPGALLTIDSMGLDDRSEVVVPTAVVAAVLAALVGQADRVHAATAAGPPLLLAIVGMYITIPETGQILPILVVAVPIALVGGPVRLARLGAAGSAASLALLASIVAEGGQPRAASIVGGLASLGVLALDPVARWLADRVRGWSAAPPPASWRSPAMVRLVALHLAVVLVASRVAGLREGLKQSTAIAGLTAIVALFALLAFNRDMERGEPHR
jgi:hypothetical protein